MAEWMDELERLAELRDKGLLTDEEFETEKVNILPARNNHQQSRNDIADLQVIEDGQKYVAIFITPTPRSNQSDQLKMLMSEWGVNRLVIENAPSIANSLRNLSEQDSLAFKKAFESAGIEVQIISSQIYLQSSLFERYKNHEFVFTSQRSDVLKEIQDLSKINPKDHKSKDSAVRRQDANTRIEKPLRGLSHQQQWNEISKERNHKNGLSGIFKRALGEALQKLNKSENLLWVEAAQVGQDNGVLLVTDNRVVVSCKGAFLSVFHSFDLKDIDSISIESKSFLVPKLVITSPGKRLEIKCTIETDKTIEKIRGAMTAAKSDTQGRIGQTLADEIRDLSKLKDEGLITEIEFQAQKAKLLEQ
tara:strand:- start:48 stop:1133 length:1086 start_codon:yes stop_codon:yes gene_type:complete